ncbi:UNVERIFIED_CONTAM: hypothetical protein GTU68_032266 [Idotea baltica]|nr:hypothetical protein [Idotea baltica]
MNNIPFGREFSDHMLVARYNDGKWQNPEVVPYGPIPFNPSMSALNYGQAVFEGMKAYKSPKGEILLFRPEDNFKRINQSAHRLCMPPIPHSVFMDGLKALLKLDHQWTPNADQGALYIRPLYFSTDEYIGVKASDSYIFTIFTCPVGSYYTEPVNLLATKDFVRAGIGGTGSAKAAGNYAGSLLPDKLAKAQGYHNVLWLDGREHQYIEECGTMNMFFVIDNKVVVPKLTGTILPGITRNSVIQLLKDKEYEVEERQVSIYELREAYREGRLQEAFGTGTAATIAHIAKIGFSGEDMILPPVEDRNVGNWLKTTLESIKLGLTEDSHNWTEKVL